jgi:hypothetical protein
MKITFFPKMAKRPFRLIIMAATIAYVLLYVLNSMLGGYWGPVAGNLTWSLGISMPTRFIWEPYIGYRDRYNITACGVLWYPLICLDQRYIHPSYDLNNTNDEAILFSKDNHIKWHPEAIRKQNRLQTEKGLWRNHCVEDPEFCLQSTTNLYSRMDTHFLALLIYDKYNTNAISKLQAVAESINANSVYSDFAKRDVRKVIQAVKELSSRAVLK